MKCSPVIDQDKSVGSSLVVVPGKSVKSFLIIEIRKEARLI